MLIQTKRFHEVIPLYRELLKLRPDRYHYVIQYAQILIEIGDFNGARDVLEGALRMRKSDARGMMMFGYLARRKEFLSSRRIPHEGIRIRPLSQANTGKFGNCIPGKI